MHQSIPAVLIGIPPEQPRGICLHCQSRGWGICKFIAARVLEYSGATPRAFDARFRMMVEFIGKGEAFVKDWLVRQGLENGRP